MDDVHFDHAASHLGKAVGIANLLRGTAYHAARCLTSFSERMADVLQSLMGNYSWLC